MSDNLSPSPKVAVVDDDPRIRALLEDELSDEGFTPCLCASGLELIELVQTDQIDMVLLDLMMPEIDGFQCLEKLRELSYSGPVIIVTALSDDSKRRQALGSGAKDYVLKPDLFDKLPLLLHQYLDVKSGS
jgi:DNA-binding response OmpR family regulator